MTGAEARIFQESCEAGRPSQRTRSKSMIVGKMQCLTSLTEHWGMAGNVEFAESSCRRVSLGVDILP